MTFRSRLLLAQAPLAACLLVVGAASMHTVAALGESAERSLSDNYRSAVAAQRMSSALERMNRQTLLRAAGWRTVPAPLEEQERFEAELRVQRANVTEPGEAEATEGLQRAWLDYRAADDAASALPAPRPEDLAGLERAREAVEAATERILALNATAMERRTLESRAGARRLLLLLTAATLGALALGVAASASLTSRTLRPLSALAGTVRRFGEGQVEARLRAAGDDEVASLAREFDTMADRLEAYRRSSLGELMRAQQSAQAAIESLHHPVLILDAAGAVLGLNGTAEAVLGLSRAWRGRRLAELPLEASLRERLEAARRLVLSGQGPFVPQRLEEAVTIPRADGPRRFLPQAVALRLEGGAALGVTIVLQDVTRLARFDELRNDLVATVAHEFRTPLTSLRLAVHLCADGGAGPLTPVQAECLEGARRDCERLLEFVDEILDLSRIQGGQVAIQATRAEVDDLLAAAASAAEPSARAAGVALEVTRAGPLPVRADADRIGLVLANLAGNALHHAPPGSRVALRAMREGRAARLEVADAGPGIAPEHHERIFERFFQVPGGRGRGVGLGLYLAREIVLAHGGAMGLDSAPGRGSTFWFTLPLA